MCAKLSKSCSEENDSVTELASTDTRNAKNFEQEKVKCIEVESQCMLKWSLSSSDSDEKYLLEGKYEGQDFSTQNWIPLHIPIFEAIKNTSLFECECNLHPLVLEEKQKAFKRFLMYMNIRIDTNCNLDESIDRFDFNYIYDNYGFYDYCFNRTELERHEHFHLLESLLAFYRVIESDKTISIWLTR